MKIFLIPDTQVKADTPTNHLAAVGNYIVAKKPDVIIHLGDHWDMPSLSSYEKKGSKYFEGKRYKTDIQAGNEGMDILMGPLKAYNKKKRKNKEKQYKPRLIFLIGNHEFRVDRAVNEDPKLEGVIGMHDFNLNKYGWEVYAFREIVQIEDIYFSHYFYNPMSGNPWGGRASTMLNNIGFSFVQGHRQGKDIAEKHLANGKSIRGLVLGSFYQHDEDYKGPQGNNHFRGCAMLHEVQQGDYNLMELSLDYLVEHWS